MSFNPLGIVGGQAIGTGVGGGITTVIEPILRDLANEAWERYQSMPVEVVLAANVVASGERSYAWGLSEAHKQGFTDERFQALVDFNDTAPDLARLYELLHRGLISEDDFREGSRKQLIEDKWLGPLVQLAQRILSPAEAAAAWQQGYMAEAEAEAEALLSGVSPARSRVQRLLAGLPPGIQDVGMRLLRRGRWDDGTFVQAVRESNIKTKYADDLLFLRDEITSPTTAAGLWLRGWLTEAEAKAIGALSGYGPEEMEHLYLNRGRPATVRQVHIGYARGAALPGAANEEEAIRTAVRQSNIRTEYADLLWAQRHTYPSAFVLRALAADGTFTQAQTEQILVESGWRPDYAAQAAEKWAGGAAGVSTKWADRARARLFTVAHNEYLDGSIDEGQARGLLQRVGATAAEQDTIITLWNAEQGVERLELTPAQIRKAYRANRYTYELAVSELVERQMTPEDADVFLTT